MIWTVPNVRRGSGYELTIANPIAVVFLTDDHSQTLPDPFPRTGAPARTIRPSRPQHFRFENRCENEYIRGFGRSQATPQRDWRDCCRQHRRDGTAGRPVRAWSEDSAKEEVSRHGSAETGRGWLQRREGGFSMSYVVVVRKSCRQAPLSKRQEPSLENGPCTLNANLGIALHCPDPDSNNIGREEPEAIQSWAPQVGHPRPIA